MKDNRINTVLLDFSFTENEKETALKKTKELFYDKVLAGLQKNLDQETRHIYIDRLEVELGVTSEAELSEKFSKALTESLSKVTYEIVRRQERHSQDKSIKKKDTGISSEALIYFSAHGYWPWYIQVKDEKDRQRIIAVFFENKNELLVFARALKDCDDRVFQRIAALVRQDRRFIQRFEEALEEIHPFFKSAPSILKEVYAAFITQAGFLSELLFVRLIQSGTVSSAADFSQVVLSVISEMADPGKKPTTAATSSLRKIKNKLEKYMPGSRHKAGMPKPEHLYMLVLEKFSEIPVQKFNDPVPYLMEDDPGKIAVTNAGLVLLHPYLSPVFRELGWINDHGRFTTEKEQQKAVLFLQYIINKRSRQPEHSLVLNKILCGWPLHVPLSTGCNFSKKEKETAGDLLDSLIGHWTVLRNTSREGLVKSFIQRKGLVTAGSDAVVLQVEKNTIDILMESLPFGIQTIKLPWNEYIIHTEWTC